MLMEVKKELRLLFLSTKYNIMKEMINPLSFVLKVLFMMLNNSTFIIQWVVLFSLKDSFGTYGFKEIMLIWGISSASFGFAFTFFGGSFKIPEYVEEGKLDSYLVQPKSVLLSVVGSYTRISAIGDLLYGLVVGIIFYHSLKNIILFLLFIITGGIIFACFSIIIGSLAFKYTKTEELSDSIMGMYLSASLYPDSVYGNILKFILYTFIPIGFSVFIPISIILNFNLLKFIVVLLFTILMMILASLAFYRGLKRYSSTNLMSSR